MTAVAEELFLAARSELAELAQRAALAFAGGGATRACASAAGAILLAGDPVTAAERAAEAHR